MSIEWNDGLLIGRTAYLSPIEFGAYIRLVLQFDSRPDIPLNDEQRARICRLSRAQWLKIKPVLAEFFDADWKPINDGSFRQRRRKAVQS